MTEPNTDRTADGRFGPGNQAAKRRISDETLAEASAIAKAGAAGTDGVWAPGGFIVSGEKDPKLRNREKWITYDNLVVNVGIVAAAVNIWLTLAGSVKWSAKPNKYGGRNAQKCVELVEEGLINARMEKPWRNVIRRQMMKRFRGFAMHAKAWRVDSKGRQVYAGLEHRPQWTIERWLQVAEGEKWYAVVQRGRSGKEFPPIPREQLFYSVEDGISSDPDGLGLFRTIAKLANTLEGLENLERIGFDGDMRGTPVGRAPLAKLAREAITVGKCDPADKAAIQAYIQAQVKFLDDLLKNHLVTKDRSIMLDSAVFNAKAADGALTPTQIYEWSLDTVKTTTGGMAELGAAISRVVGFIAILMNAEWLLLGSADSSGTYGMHANKTAMTGMAMNGGLDDLADDANRDLVWPMVARNGYNPETDAPTLEHEPIPTESVEVAARALLWIRQAALLPGDAAENVLRGRMELPNAPEVNPAMLGAPRAVGMPPNVTTTDGAGDNGKAQTADMKDNPDNLPAGDKTGGKEGTDA